MWSVLNGDVVPLHFLPPGVFLQIFLLLFLYMICAVVHFIHDAVALLKGPVSGTSSAKLHTNLM